MPITSGLTIPPAAALQAVGVVREITAAGDGSVVPVTYGMDRQPALLLNVLPAADDANVVLLHCLWGHALHAVDELRWQDQPLPTGASAVHYTGSQVVPDASLVAAFAAQGITFSSALTGYAHSVVRMPTAEFQGSLQISARLWGRRVYDPRKDSTQPGGSGAHRLDNPATWEWSDNPALALADWTANTVYGAGEPVVWASVPAVAAANDALVGTPGEKRRLIGLTLAAGNATVAAVAEALRAYAGCWLVPTAQGLRLVADADAAPVASYSHAAGQIAGISPLSRRDLGNTPTVVEVQYTDTTQVPWRQRKAQAALPGAGTTRPWRLSSVPMPGVQRYSQALREAIERLNKLNLGDLSCDLDVFDEGIRHEVGDIVTITHPVGVSAKPMRVTGGAQTSHGRWRLALTEHDPAVYSSEVQTQPSVPDTVRIAPAGYGEPVVDFTVVELPGGLLFSWQEPTAYNHRRTVLQLHPGGTLETAWVDAQSPFWQGESTQHLVPWPADGAYAMLARHENRAGGLSLVTARVTFSIVNQRLTGVTRTWLQSTGETAQWLATLYDEFGEPEGTQPAWWTGAGLSLLIDTPQIEDGAATEVVPAEVEEYVQTHATLLTEWFEIPDSEVEWVNQTGGTVAVELSSGARCSGVGDPGLNGTVLLVSDLAVYLDDVFQPQWSNLAWDAGPFGAAQSVQWRDATVLTVSVAAGQRLTVRFRYAYGKTVPGGDITVSVRQLSMRLTALVR